MVRQLSAALSFGKSTRSKSVETIHECRIVTHLWGHWGQEVPDPLLLLDIHVEVPTHDQTAVSPDVFLTTAELARGHEPS